MAGIGGISEYTPEIGIEICNQLAEGLSLRTVCTGEGMPDKRTVFNWLRKYPEFKAAYDIAKQEASDALVEEIQDIADDGRNDYMASLDPDNPGYKLNGEAINRSRLRVDTRKWIASKMKPKKYGDKLELAGDPKAPLSVMIQAMPTDEKV